MEPNFEELVKITLLNENPRVVRMSVLQKGDRFKFEGSNHDGIYIADEHSKPCLYDEYDTWSIIAHLDNN